MGRMFRIITEGSLDYANGGPATATAELDPFVAGPAPYIEVGGGTAVFHAPKAVAPVEPPKPAPVLPTRQAVIDDRYLSVALHPVMPKPTDPPPPAVHPDVVAFHHPDHPVSAEYRALRDELRKQVGADAGPKAVLFASAAADNGTTTVLLNLAVTLAKEPGTRVLVVDADLDHPTAARKMGLTDVPGLAEVLAASLPAAWALQPTPVAKLQVLAAGKPTPATSDALAADFPRLVAQLRQWFDWVLIDGGVWGERPPRDATSPAYDGVYLVARKDEFDRPAVQAVRGEVAKLGGLLRGFITTRA